MKRALLALAGSMLAIVGGGCFQGTQSVRPPRAGPLVEAEIRGICNVGYSGGAAGSSRPAPTPKEGVSILVTDANSDKFVTETRTDAQGCFRFSLRAGTYRVLARDDRLAACSPAQKTVRVEAGKPVDIDLTVYVLTP
jgi:hypothetical protein